MLSIIKSFGLTGINGYLVNVEVDLNQGLPNYDLVGLVGTSTKESKERVRSAIKNSGFKYPILKITINLAPADTKKEGPLYDLPIAIGILSASEQVNIASAQRYLMIGELGLNGDLKKVNGVLPILISARQLGFKKIILPKDNEKQIFGIVPTELFYTQEPILAPIVKRKLYCKTVALDCISFRVIPHQRTQILIQCLSPCFCIYAVLTLQKLD